MARHLADLHPRLAERDDVTFLDHHVARERDAGVAGFGLLLLRPDAAAL